MDKRLTTLTPNSICPTCNTSFYTTPSRLNTFCSVECSYKAYQAEHSGECPQCGREFILKTFKKVGYKQTYCSMECYLQSKARYCDYCGGRISQGKRNKCFCSRVCMGLAYTIDHVGSDNPNWRGGIDYYGGGWKELSKVILARDDYTCQECGVRGGYMEAHHIIPASFYRRSDLANTKFNLITLCRGCHNALRQLGEMAIPKMLSLRIACQTENR